jgi:hypothetical protein
MLTTSLRDTCLGNLGGFVGLIKSFTNWRAGTVTEAAYTGYGTRPAITYGAAADTSPVAGRQKSNSAAVTFPQNTGSNEDQIGYGIWSAATAGTLHAIGMLDTDPPVFGVGQTDDFIHSIAHGLQTDQRVYFLAAPGGTTPTGLSENTAYFVLAAGLTADLFKLSTTSGGAAVDVTVGGSGLFISYKAVTVATNATPEFAIGAIVIQI